MIARRLLAYFLVAMAFAVTATVVFEVYSLGRAADLAFEEHVFSAKTVARFVGATLSDQADHVRTMLHDLAPVLKDEAAVTSRLHTLRNTAVDVAGVAVLDRERRIVAADLDRGDLPPPETLLPALRHLEGGSPWAVTDLWRGVDGHPRVALAVLDGEKDHWLAGVIALRLDGAGLERMFHAFSVDEFTRIQLVDSQGIAIYSTKRDERYRSVVHGTYFADKMRLGESAAMRCHSCHLNGEAENVRANDIAAVAPIPGASWSVCLRESVDRVLAPMREIAFALVGLASLILGAFLGFFIFLSRHVLAPIRQLVTVANGLAQDRSTPPFRFDAGDEFALLASSLERLRSAPSAAEAADDPAPVPRGARSATPPPALDAAMEAVLADIAAIRPFSCGMLLVASDRGPIARAHPASLRLDDAKTTDALLRIGAVRTWVTPAELEELGLRLPGLPPETRSLSIQRIQLHEGLSAQLWIGIQVEHEHVGTFLAPALGLVAKHVKQLLLLNVLHGQLSREHEQKNRMLRHLLEAEDEERRRIAREIHDETAQVLNALLLDLETFPADPKAPQQAERLGRAKKLVERLIDETDRLIQRLRPAVLDDLGLVDAVRATGKVLSDAGIRFELEVQGERDAVLPKEVEVAVYRVFQEALTNVHRHSGAKSVRSALGIGPTALRGSIEDDGHGMDLSRIDDAPEGGHWGLLGMRERIVQLGGSIRFATSERGGLRVEFDVPTSGAAGHGS